MFVNLTAARNLKAYTLVYRYTGSEILCNLPQRFHRCPSNDSLSRFTLCFPNGDQVMRQKEQRDHKVAISLYLIILLSFANLTFSFQNCNIAFLLFLTVSGVFYSLSLTPAPCSQSLAWQPYPKFRDKCTSSTSHSINASSRHPEKQSHYQVPEEHVLLVAVTNHHFRLLHPETFGHGHNSFLDRY